MESNKLGTVLVAEGEPGVRDIAGQIPNSQGLM